MKKSLLLPICALLLLTTAIVIRFSNNPGVEVNRIGWQQSTPPHFPGGEKALYKFLDKNLKWPAPSIDAQGRVLIGFNVEKDGRLTDIKVLKGLNPPFDNEALRVVKIMPKWVPAIKGGIAVKSKCSIPINFTISG